MAESRHAVLPQPTIDIQAIGMVPARPVPDRYRGVWQRTLLTAGNLRDTSSAVFWMQTSLWHADIRIPTAARPVLADPTEQLSSQQGFCGITQIETVGQLEQCAWHHQFSVQPPQATPDVGWMAFETHDRLIETGVHTPYLEVWERLPESVGRYVVLAGIDGQGNDNGVRLLVAGRYLMLAKPRKLPWPHCVTLADSLASVITRYPQQMAALLQCEISFGTFDGQTWAIQQSTLPSMEGQTNQMQLERTSEHIAHLLGDTENTLWQIIEWSAP